MEKVLFIITEKELCKITLKATVSGGSPQNFRIVNRF